MVLIDHKGEIHNFLEDQQDSELPLSQFDWTTYEFANGLEDEFLVLHAEGVKGLSSKTVDKLLKHQALVVFSPDKKGLDSLPGRLRSKILFTITGDDDPKRVRQQLEIANKILIDRLTLKTQLFTIQNELNEVLSELSGELGRVKSLHDHRAQKRIQNFRGLDLVTKYAAGEGVGGEFFDFIKKNHQILIFMSSTNSYLASSQILQECASFQENAQLSVKLVAEFLRSLQKKLRRLQQSRAKEVEVSILAAVFDLNTRSFEGYQCGSFQLVSSISDQNIFAAKGHKGFLSTELDELSFDYDFGQEERVLLLSPGLGENWKEASPKVMMPSLLVNKKIKLVDILDEIFFELKKEKKGRFLAYDASAILMETHGHAIYEV